MKNHICFSDAGDVGTVVSDALFVGRNDKPTVCNVIWDDGQHCTEKIENLLISEHINPNPPKW